MNTNGYSYLALLTTTLGMETGFPELRRDLLRTSPSNTELMGGGGKKGLVDGSWGLKLSSGSQDLEPPKSHDICLGGMQQVS